MLLSFLRSHKRRLDCGKYLFRTLSGILFGVVTRAGTAKPWHLPGTKTSPKTPCTGLRVSDAVENVLLAH